MVAISLEPGGSQVATMLGVLLAGGVAAPLNTRLAPGELDEYLASVDPRWHLIEAPADGDSGFCPEPIDERSIAFAFPTGGTTGTPKAALWTHRSLFLAIVSSCIHLDVRPSDVELYVSPFFHVTLIPGLFATLTAGGTAIVPDDFDAAATADLVARGAVTRMFGTPTVIDRMVTQLPFGAGATATPTIVFGASRSDDGFVDRLRAAFPRARLFSGYGATEFGAVVRLYPDDVAAGGRGVGRPVAGVRVRIVDTDGNDVPTGRPGEIAVASPWQMERYAGRGEPAATLCDGAIRSGDRGHIDADGYLHLDGRLKEIIKTGGETVFPAEVERTLLAHPSVVDAAVFGVADREWGERVEALVVVAAESPLDEADVMAFCRHRLAGYKVPKRIRAVPELPYTANMKLDRRRLAAIAGRAVPSP